MPIKHKTLFIHIPKCGGHSIEHALKIPHKIFFAHEYSFSLLFGTELQHLTYREAEIILPSCSFSRSFTVIRNPIDRLVSEYNWSGPWLGTKAFEEERVKVGLERNDRILDRHLLPQNKFLFGKGQVQQIFTFGQFEQIAEYLGVSSIPHLNYTKIKNDNFLVKELSTIARKYYADDFELFHSNPQSRTNKRKYHYSKKLKLNKDKSKIASYINYANKNVIIYDNRILSESIKNYFQYWLKVENGENVDISNLKFAEADEVKIFWLLENIKKNQGYFKFIQAIRQIAYRKIKLSRKYIFTWILYKLIQKITQILN